ncbi:MAG TPA: aldo/keto reductase, partial [Ilumatobacteraceae bacterium]|nr:aldo/keto reductase [Ilumatobacteraceae bacterium]
MTLRLRHFGTTDMRVTNIGIGASALGGGDWALGWGDQDDADSIACIHRALEAGINWIDTASLYGLGHSEDVVARALHGIPDADRPYVFTKCGIGWDPYDRSKAPWSDCSADAIKRCVEGSLRRLRVDRLDLCQIHWPAADGTPLEEYWGAMLELRAEGKIRAAGLSNHGVTRMKQAEALGHVDSLQPPFSAIKRGAAAELLPWCAAHGVATIAYSPMEGGLLTGAFSHERVASLSNDDQRRLLPEYTTELGGNLQIAAAMAVVAASRGVPTPAIAVAWTLSFPALTGSIVGARTPAQVDGWL